MRLLWRVMITMCFSQLGFLLSVVKQSMMPGLITGVFIYILWKPLFDKEREDESKSDSQS